MRTRDEIESYLKLLKTDVEKCIEIELLCDIRDLLTKLT